MLVESMLDQENQLLSSIERALYVQAAFEAGLIQELRTIRRGQQELFLTDVPMHIVLAIDRDLDEIVCLKLLEFLDGMVECMMTHGLSTRFAINRILALIEEGYDVEDDDEFCLVRTREKRLAS